MKANSFQSAESSDGGVERFVVRRDVQFVDETDEAAVGGASPEAKTKPLAGDQGGGGGAEGSRKSAGVTVGGNGGQVLGLRKTPNGASGKVSLGEGGDDDDSIGLSVFPFGRGAGVWLGDVPLVRGTVQDSR